ncbi:hypothetical protein ACFYKX_01645 [Cytobacillus sp. FJAT-54145]|uniref:YozE SAM-like domain-containing protein n=1 Tax=Cytobacillus spartinae TaxID=3299023 RepID=A0ABW6K8Q2_9BACI
MKVQPNDNYIFTTTVSDHGNHDEFVIQLYKYLSDSELENSPSRTISNFDELISFFEELDVDKLEA